MAVKAARRIPRKRGKISKETVIPAPTQGMDGRINLSEMPQRNCIYAYNLVPSEYGMRTRLGTKDHQLAITGTTIRTIIPFKGAAAANDKIFVATTTGIYDVTTGGGSATTKFTWPSSANDAGYGVYTHFTNAAGAQFILFADGENGLHVYTESTGNWTLSGAVTSVTVADVRFVAQHQNRIWYVEADKTEARYAAIGAIDGSTSLFVFGQKFKHGGFIAGMWSWSVDGGGGTDDILVVASQAGDIIAYDGTDPSAAATWASRGQYYIGELPGGRRMACEVDGTLYILSAFGITSMSDLLKGVSRAELEKSSIAYKVSRFIRDYFILNPSELGWELAYLPDEGVLAVNMPLVASAYTSDQFVLSITTGGWGIWRDLNYYTAVDWEGTTYYALDDDIWTMTGSLDGVANNGTGGVSIDFSIMGAYTDLGEPATFKIIDFIRPQWISNAEPDFGVLARYDFDTEEVNVISIVSTEVEHVWDTALWDVGTWDGGKEGHAAARGACGIGRWVSIAMSGSVTERAVLTGWGLSWTSGQFL